MRRHYAIALLIVVNLARASTVAAAQAPGAGKDEEAIRAIIAATTDAFSRHDAKAWVQHCTSDAQLVTVRGESMKGVAQIEKGLAAIFQTRGRNVTLKTVEVSVRFIRPDVALAHVRNELSGLLSPDGQVLPPHEELSVRVFVRKEGTWRITAFHNTIVQISAPATSRSPAASQERAGVMGDLLRDVAVLETRIVGLATAMPPAAYKWRPGEGVRSTEEVLLHVAGDNYFLPALIGVPAPAETGIDGKDNKTVAAFEARRLTRDQIVAELTKSFAFLKKAMSDTPDTALEMPPRNSVRKTTTRATWIATLTHVHEHLGQLIAYARSNNITPPWNK